MERFQEIERSIIKKFRKEIWAKFVHAVQTYNLIQENDNIMVCISGGKDSFLLAKCIQELIRHGNVKFSAHFVVMNPGYTEFNIDKIKENAEILNIPIEIFMTDIYESVKVMKAKSPCYMCARMRRGHLYNKAQELGCNKIALGHHFDDVIETTLLSMFYGAELKTMLPKLYSENFKGLELIRPLYLVKESAIKAWRDYNNLTFINCACTLLEECKINEDLSKRLEIKNLIENLRHVNKDIDYNIFKSMDNINLNCVLGMKYNKKYYSFLDNYEEKKKCENI